MKWCFGLFLLAACGANPGGVAPGERVITGELVWQQSGPGRPALRLVALWPAATCGEGIVVGEVSEGVALCAHFGEPFDRTPFRLVLPCDLTVNLAVATVAPAGLGDVLAFLSFERGDGLTTLLAREPACRDTPRLATNVIDLGHFVVGAGPVILGGLEGGTNPLGIVDTDGDSVANLADGDDDDDGVIDADDLDADGDGAADAAQVVEL
jgi:hypothetical protein